MSTQKLQTTDLFLVNRAADSYKSTYGDFKTNVLDSHLIQSDTPPTYPDIVAGTIWVDTSQDPPVIHLWDGTQWVEIQGGAQVVDPDRTTDITFNPPVTGSGTANDPFVLTTVTCFNIGGTVTSNEVITIANQPANTLFEIENLGGEARFSQPFGITDADGEWSGKLTYTDTPDSAAGDTYESLFNIGTECYIKWVVVQIANQTPIVGSDGTTQAPNASPPSVDIGGNENLYGTGTGTWADGASTLRTVASSRFANNDAIVFGVDNGPIDQTSKTIVDGQTIVVQFDEATVNAANDGDTISGAITNDDGFYQEWYMVKDTNALAFSIAPLVDQALSTVVTTGNNAIQGVNAPSEVTLVAGATLTDVEVSVDGGAWTSAFPVTFNPGDPLQLRGTTGAANDTEYTATVAIGTTEATWSVTTTDVGASIPNPQITSPSNGSLDLDTNVILVSDAYQDNGTGAGAHTESDWQVYEADLDIVLTNKITDVDGTAGILSYETDTIQSVDAFDASAVIVNNNVNVAAGVPENAFDGDITSQYAFSFTNGFANFPSTSIQFNWELKPGDKFEINLRRNGQPDYDPGSNGYLLPWKFTLDDDVVIDVAAPSVNPNVTMDEKSYMDFSYIITKETTYVKFIQDGNFHIADIRVNGQKLGGSTTLTFPTDENFDKFDLGDVVQDGGQNQSYKWSDGGDNNVKPGEPWANAFNGKADDPNCVANFGATARITFPANTTFNKIELSYWCAGNQNQIFNVNGDDVSSVRPNTISNGVFVDVTSLVSGNTLSYIEFNNSDDANPNVFSAVKLDGKLLTDSDGAFAETQVKIISKDEDATPPTITVDGGDWYGSDTSGTGGGETKLVKDVAYDTQLTVSGDKDLDVLTGGSLMTDGVKNAGGTFDLTGYKLVTTDIESVENLNYSTSTVIGSGQKLSNPNSNHLPEFMFDGDPDTWMQFSGIANPQTVTNDNCVTVTLPEPIENVSSVQILGSGSTNRGTHAWINDRAYNGDSNNNNIGQPKNWYYANTGGETTLRKINFATDGESGAMSVYAIKVNGVELIDSGITLTFPGAVGTNPDLRYFQPGDMVQGNSEWDQSEMWSQIVTYGTGFYNGTIENSFNGVSSPNFTGYQNNEECWIEFPDASYLEGKRIEQWSPNGNTKEQYWSFTQGTGDLQRCDTKPCWTDLGIAPAGQKRLYCYGSNSPLITMIRVDGKILVDSNVEDPQGARVISTGYANGQNTMTVDSGTWSGSADFPTSQTWSEQVVGTDTQDASSYYKMFDGDTSTRAEVAPTNQTYTYTWNLPQEILDLTINKLEVYAVVGGNNGNVNYCFNINGKADFPARGGNGSVTSNTWHDLTSLLDANKLTSFVYKYVHYTGLDAPPISWAAIRINDEIYIDQGDTHVEYQTNGGVGNVVGTDPDNNLIYVEDTGDRDNRWIADDNSEGTDFFVTNNQGGGLPDAPVNEPPGSDYTKIDESLNDTTNLTTYTPSGLNDGKAYFSRVKYRDDTAPDAVESEWSPWNGFTTQAP